MHTEDRAKRALMHLVGMLLLVASSAACASSAVSEAGNGGQPACVSCHMPEYLSAAHHPGKKPTECGVCHAQEGWHPSRLD